MSCEIEISVEAPGWATLPGVEACVEAAIQAALKHVGSPPAQSAEVSVLLCDDAAIKVLNKTWRGFDKATNVLSFPADRVTPEFRMYGDIAVACETARREADAEGKTIEAHLSHLVVHGFLHLCGHDHATVADAERMEEVERRILATLAIADPYAGTDVVEKGHAP